MAGSNRGPVGCLVAVVLTVAAVVAYAELKGDPPSGSAAQSGAPAPSTAPPSPSPVPGVVVSDNPAFDLAGSGDGCRMHYFQDGQGETVTVFTLTVAGELIAHVSGPGGVVRHDEREGAGTSRFTYAFPLGQATDMGAVLYLPDGSQQSCAISAGADAP